MGMRRRSEKYIVERGYPLSSICLPHPPSSFLIVSRHPQQKAANFFSSHIPYFITMTELRSESIASARPSQGERRQSAARKVVDDHVVTGAGHITLRESIIPVSLVTILFFLWGFAYGLLDVLNAHFQTTLGISQGMSGGLQAAYVSPLESEPQSGVQ